MGRPRKKPVARVANVSELKAGLSAYLGQVKRGEEVLVTERGRPIAKLVPVRRDEGSSGPASRQRLLDLERRGVITIGTGRIPDDFWDWEPPRVPDGAIERWIAWERGEDGR